MKIKILQLCLVGGVFVSLLMLLVGWWIPLFFVFAYLTMSIDLTVMLLTIVLTI